MSRVTTPELQQSISLAAKLQVIYFHVIEDSDVMDSSDVKRTHEVGILVDNVIGVCSRLKLWRSKYTGYVDECIHT